MGVARSKSAMGSWLDSRYTLTTTIRKCVLLVLSTDWYYFQILISVKGGGKHEKMCIFETTVTTRLLVNTIANYISLESLWATDCRNG